MSTPASAYVTDFALDSSGTLWLSAERSILAGFGGVTRRAVALEHVHI
jgi:hypothetical protein